MLQVGRDDVADAAAAAGMIDDLLCCLCGAIRRGHLAKADIVEQSWQLWPLSVGGVRQPCSC